MRIMHVSTRLILGGSQENTVLSCEGQADDGHDVSLVFGPIHGPEGTMLPRVEAHGGIEPIETPNLVREVSPLRDRRCLGELRALIRAWKPDVVHTHSSKAGILGRAAAWRERVPAVVHTIHGLPFHPYQSRLAHFAFVRAERWAAKRCHAIVCVADAMRDQALAQGVGRPEQYVTIRSGMEIEPFLATGEAERRATRDRFGIPHDAFVIGTVSRLAELKGHDDLIDGLGPLLRERPDVRLLWVGDGWWRERLLARVAEAGLTERVHAIGRVEPEEIPACIAAMDLLAHPSYREGLPRAVPQALLSGVPVVASDVDGTREACRDGETGLLHPPGDAGALATAIRWMLEHATERARMAEAGRALCTREFAAATMVRRLDELYRDRLDAAGR